MRRFRHHPLLGTLLEVMVDAADEPIDDAVAAEIDRVVTDEIDRLGRLLSVYDPTSALERWKRGELEDPGAEVNRVLAEALDWQQRSGGAFNTATGALTAVWRAAEARGTPPPADELAAVAASIASPSYRIDDAGVARPTGDVSGVSLNAFAKGWIVDRAIDAATRIAPSAEIAVSAGGDLLHRGRRAIPVGIENPLRPYDNEPPIAHLEVLDAGLASSGRARRGFRIGGEWFAHVVDPTTGATVDRIASISVLGPDAATADVVATILGLAPPDEIPDRADEWGVAVFVVRPDGTRLANDAWHAATVTP